MRVALLFTDGIGIGKRDPSVNPLAREAYLLSQFDDGIGAPLPDGARLERLETTFGVPGRPQSATNQTAILTGEPAPRVLGRHVLGYPNPPLRALIDERSIVKRMVAAGLSATFANAYPPAYLDALGLPRRPGTAAADPHLPPRLLRRLRPSATTCAFAAAGVALRTFQDARDGEGLTHDLDGSQARGRGFDLPTRSPTDAAEIFWRLAQDFTLFEHFRADEAGHARDFEAARRALGSFDAFARAVIARRPPDACVLVCSDHGNVEDLSGRGHTTNRVPFIAVGLPEPTAAGDVAGVGRLILSLLAVKDA